MQTAIFPEISKNEFEQAKQKALKEYDPWHLIRFFTHKYETLIFERSKIIADFTDFTSVQRSLFLYIQLDYEIWKGGFIQAIYNGLGTDIFEDLSFSNDMKNMGAEKIALLIEKAKPVYEKYKTKIETARENDSWNSEDGRLTEFPKLYRDITEFEPLDDEYSKIYTEPVVYAERYAVKIQQYIETHLNEFAVIVE